MLSNYVLGAIAGSVIFLIAYILGVNRGKRYERASVTFTFQELLKKLLHYTAQQDYRSLHLLLQELCADEEQLEMLRKEVAADESSELEDKPTE